MAATVLPPLTAPQSKTEAIRRALTERAARLSHRVDHADRGGRARRFLESTVWPLVPPEEVGRRLTAAEEDALLGFGQGGA